MDGRKEGYDMGQWGRPELNILKVLLIILFQISRKLTLVFFQSPPIIPLSIPLIIKLSNYYTIINFIQY